MERSAATPFVVQTAIRHTSWRFEFNDAAFISEVGLAHSLPFVLE